MKTVLMLCFKIDNFIFSFLLSFIIDVYNLILLTPKMIIAGINIIFCKNIVIKTNIKPLILPNTYTHDAIVYPKQNPLNSNIPKTIGIPIIVVPENHNNKTNNIFPFISSFNSPKKSPFWIVLVCSIYVFIYSVISSFCSV